MILGINAVNSSYMPANRQRTSRRHIGALDGLRGVAAIAVFFGHFGVHVGRGVDLGAFSEFFQLAAHGLTLFFVLSGFLLYLPFAQYLLGKREFPDIKHYASARFWRIYPAYIAIWVVAQVAGLLYTRTLNRGEDLSDISLTVGRIGDPWQVVANLTLLHSYIPKFVKTGIGPSWSLTVEMTFYLLLPVVVWALAKMSCKVGLQPGVLRAALPVVMMLALGAFGHAVYAYIVGQVPDARVYDLTLGSTWAAVVNLSFATRAGLFGAGMATALGYIVARDKVWTLGVKTVVTVGVIGVIVLALTAYQLTRFNPLMGLVFAAGIFVLTVPSSMWGMTVLSKVLSVTPAQYLGRLSYSLYLWHGPALWVTFWVVGEDIGPGVFFIALVVTTVVILLLSTVTYQYVEKPSMAWGKRLTELGATTTSRRSLRENN